jgi:predicted O-methyltransferase YrrM
MARTASRLYALDTFEGDKDTGKQPTLYPFLQTLDRHGVRHKVVILAGSVEDLIPILGGRVGMVFVDGSHDDQSVERDTLLALRLTAPGGVIAWHDWRMPSVRSGVKRACDCVPGVAEDNLLYWER